ncbi:MAG: hypothetical protein ACAH95_13270 [Fimbriimonas sp.]
MEKLIGDPKSNLLYLGLCFLLASPLCLFGGEMMALSVAALGAVVVVAALIWRRTSS